MKWLKVGALVMLTFVLVTAIGAVWTRKSLARLEATVAREIAARRAEKLAPRPVSRGGAVRPDVNAADEYTALFAGFGRDFPAYPKDPKSAPKGTSKTLDDFARAAPGPLPDWVLPWLDTHRPQIDAVRAAACAERCVWPDLLEDLAGAGRRSPDFQGMRHLTSLLILEGHRLAAAGDAARAVEAYLDSARIGLDLGAGEWALIGVLMGDNLVKRALLLARGVAAGGGLDAAARARLGAEVAALEALVPSLPRTFDGERIGGLSAMRAAAQTGVYEGVSLPPLFPVRALVAVSWRSYDAGLREIAALSEMPDGPERTARISAFEGAVAASWNPLLRRTALNYTSILRSNADLHQTFESLREALAGPPAGPAPGTPAPPPEGDR